MSHPLRESSNRHVAYLDSALVKGNVLRPVVAESASAARGPAGVSIAEDDFYHAPKDDDEAERQTEDRQSPTRGLALLTEGVHRRC